MPVEAGDLIFCHSKGAISKAIRIGEWLRGHRGRWNHVAIVTDVAADGVQILQAEARGVTCKWYPSPASIAPGGHVELVKPECDTLEMLRFASEQVGRRYGFVTIASICVTIVVPWFLTIRIPSTWICSAVAAESLRAGGWFHDWPDVYQVTPQQLYDVLEDR